MRRNVAAGIKSGIISSMPLATYLAAISLPKVRDSLDSVLTQFPSLVHESNSFLLVSYLNAFIGTLAIMAGFGALAGFMFVLIFSKLPFRSTYVKAIVPSVIFWIIQTLSALFSIASVVQYLSFELPNLGVIVLDAVIFSYLFDQWSTARSETRLKKNQ